MQASALPALLVSIWRCEQSVWTLSQVCACCTCASRDILPTLRDIGREEDDLRETRAVERWARLTESWHYYYDYESESDSS